MARVRIRALTLVGLVAVALVGLAGVAQADTVTVDFETGPAIGTPVNDDYKTSAFTFWQRSDAGFRPYRRVPGVATQSGTVAADIGPDHCYPDEVDDPLGCEFPVPGTEARLTRTASAVTVYAGLFSAPNDSVSAVLTAYRADNAVAGSVTVPIGIGITTPVTVTSAAPDIARWALFADGPGKAAAELGFDDLTYTFPTNSLPEITVAGPVNTVPVLQGSSIDVPVQVTRLNGSDGPVRLSVSGLPTGVTATFTPNPVPGTQSTATMRLAAASDATATPLQNATLTADPQGNAAVAPGPRTAPFTVRVTSAYDLRSTDADALHLPQCAPVERTFSLNRDRAFPATVQLTVESAPAGVSAEILPSATVLPGGGFNAGRTLRVSRGADPVPDGAALTIRARAAGYPDRTMTVPVDNATPEATVAPPAIAGIARLLRPGTTVRLDGNGFCTDTAVRAGNEFSITDTAVADDHRSLTFTVPRAATTGPVTVVPPTIRNYTTSNVLTVRSFRGENGFAFANYGFSALSISELTEAFGADDLFIQVNLCWPWSKCYVPTGILDPIAAAEWPIFSLILRGGDGHCYGMNRAIQEILARKTSLNRWASGVSRVHDLPDATGPKNGLGSYLDSRQALQLSSEALKARFDRDENISAQLRRIHDELEAGRYPGVVMKTGLASGHMITAFDMERDPDGSMRILGYDNNLPLTDAELSEPFRHAIAEAQASVITVDPAGNWTFTRANGVMASGGGSDGKLYSVNLADIPDNPTLPGLSDTPLLLVDIVASVDRAVESGPPPAGGSSEPITDQQPNTPATTDVVVAPKGADRLSHTVKGLKSGTYSQLVAGDGFVGGVRDVATGKDVKDGLSGMPASGALQFAGGRDRRLGVDVAIDHGGVHRAASVATGASKGGKDTVALGRGQALSYTHDGATTRASFTLTSVAANGGPATFSSGAVTVRRGERVTLKPVSWRSLDRVRASFSKGGSRMLRNRTSFGARLRLGTPKLSKGRAAVATSITRLPAQTAGGVVLRLVRGHRTVARKAVAVTDPQRGRKTYTWTLPSKVRRGTYRLVANMVLAGGDRAMGRRSVSKAARVRVG